MQEGFICFFIQYHLEVFHFKPWNCYTKPSLEWVMLLISVWKKNNSGWQ